MPDVMTWQETEYGLAEAAILAQPWLSATTLPDVLARPEVVLVQEAAASPPRVVIRRRGSEVSVEVQGGGPRWRSFRKGVEAVGDLLGLAPGWNSYSARPIAFESARRAIQVLAEFLCPETPTPAVVPTVRGGIQLEWHTQGVNIEVYVGPSEGVRFFAESVETGEAQEIALAGHEQELRLWLQRISER
jgi:hypothetical protein